MLCSEVLEHSPGACKRNSLPYDKHFSRKIPLAVPHQINLSACPMVLIGILQIFSASSLLKISITSGTFRQPESSSLKSLTLASLSSLRTNDCTTNDDGLDNHLSSQILTVHMLPTRHTSLAFNKSFPCQILLHA
jgi:hypothetical protein